MLFSLKSYAKKCFTVWRNYFSIKSYSTFSAKMFQAPSFGNVYYVYCIPYMEVTVDFLLYMVETVWKKKKGKTWRNEVDSKNSNFRDSFLNIEKEFHYTVKDFFCITF